MSFKFVRAPTGNYLFFRNAKKVYYVDEGNANILEIVGGKREYSEDQPLTHYKGYKKMCVPFFEIACNPQALYDSNLKDQPAQRTLDFFISSATKTMLEKERKIFKKLKRYLKNGKGIFVLRVDLTVLPALDPDKNLVGFSIFEQVGAAVVMGEKYKIN